MAIVLTLSQLEFPTPIGVTLMGLKRKQALKI